MLMASQATFLTLPYEIRLIIYEMALPTEPISSLKCLGFRNPNIETPRPNIVIKLPTAALMALYTSNPAGESRGRFWRKPTLLAVCQQTKEEVVSVFDRLPATIGTWMSFLSNRPSELLHHITHVEFKYNIGWLWSPTEGGHRGQSFDNVVFRIGEGWSESLEHLSALMPSKHLSTLTIDFGLVQPTVFTYNIRTGFTKPALSYMKDRLFAVTEEALTKFRDDGKWPEQELVVDGTLDYINQDVVPNSTNIVPA